MVAPMVVHWVVLRESIPKLEKVELFERCPGWAGPGQPWPGYIVYIVYNVYIVNNVCNVYCRYTLYTVCTLCIICTLCRLHTIFTIYNVSPFTRIIPLENEQTCYICLETENVDCKMSCCNNYLHFSCAQKLELNNTFTICKKSNTASINISTCNDCNEKIYSENLKKWNVINVLNNTKI